MPLYLALFLTACIAWPQTTNAQFAQALMPPSPETVSAAQGLFEALCEIGPNPIKGLDRLMQKEACRDLPVGGFRVIRKRWDESETTVEQAYVLRRTADDTHTLEFNLNFKDIQKSFLQAGDKSPTEKEIRARMNKCLEENENLLLGPDGQKLRLKVLDSKSSGPEHRRIETRIDVHHDEDFRSNSRGYQKSVSCVVFIHELLHLAGLADEYIETDNLKNRKSICRAHNFRPSIMGDGDAALRHVQDLRKPDYHRYTIRYCSCETNSCPKSDESPKSDCAPSELTLFHTETRSEPMEDLFKESQAAVSSIVTLFDSGFASPSKEASKFRVRVVQVKKETAPSLLRPAHYRAMVYPGCREKNQTYYRCTKAWSGQGWKEQLFGSVENCPKLPAECETLSWTD